MARTLWGGYLLAEVYLPQHLSGLPVPQGVPTLGLQGLEMLLAPAQIISAMAAAMEQPTPRTFKAPNLV